MVPNRVIGTSRDDGLFTKYPKVDDPAFKVYFFPYSAGAATAGSQVIFLMSRRLCFVSQVVLLFLCHVVFCFVASKDRSDFVQQSQQSEESSDVSHILCFYGLCRADHDCCM